MWSPWTVSEPQQLPEASVREQVGAETEGEVMLRGVAGLLIGAAVALTAITGFPF